MKFYRVIQIYLLGQNVRAADLSMNKMSSIPYFYVLQIQQILMPYGLKLLEIFIK